MFANYFYTICLCSVFVSCGGEVILERNQSVRDFPEIAQSGKLSVVLRYSPHSFFMYRGEPMGYEYELLTWMASDLNLKLDIHVPRTWTGVMELLKQDKVDLIAAPLAVTMRTLNTATYTEYFHTTRPMLVQRKPAHWEKMKIHQIEKELIRNPLELIGRKVVVAESSAYHERLIHLAKEMGGQIQIALLPPNVEVDSLIEGVVHGQYDRTVAEENVLPAYEALYRELDAKTALGFEQRISWAVHRDKKKLLDTINTWIQSKRNGADPRYQMLYTKYFRNQSSFVKRMKSPYNSLDGGKLSPYDSLFKKYAPQLGWDWKLLAAVAFEESGWNPEIISPMGAVGLMQIMPSTAERFGANNSQKPDDNIKAAVGYLMVLNEHWKSLPPPERLAFVIASYNVGLGHILDARRLAKDHGESTDKWFGEIESWLIKKSVEPYLSSPLVENGFCRGAETSRYVQNIMQRFENFKLLYSRDAI